MNARVEQLSAEPLPVHNQSVLPLFLVLARRLRLLCGLPLAAALMAIVVCKLSTPIFTATARILPPQYNENTVNGMQNQLGGESQLGNSALTLKNPTDLFVGVLKSRTIVDAVIEANRLADYFEIDKSGDLRARLQDVTVIRAAKDGIVAISVEDADPQVAAQIANSYVRQFYAYSAELGRQQALRRAEFYEQALVSAREQLVLADEALARIERATGFTRLMGQDQAIVQAAAELQAQIAAREIQLKTMASYATASNPDVQLIQRELAELRTELARMGGSGAKEAPLKSGPFVDLGQAPDALLVHTQARRDVAYWESTVSLLGRFSELGKIDVTRDMSLFQVLDWAVPPDDKSKPRTRIAAVLALLGSGFACLFWVLAGAYVSERRTQSADFDRNWLELTATIRGYLPLGGRRA